MNRSTTISTLARLLLLLPLAGGCGSGHATDSPRGEPKATPECASYERELRACSAAVGGPPVAADTMASALSQSDDAERLHMESACARDRIRLRASCK